jgi:hypothetical protein
VGPSSRWSKRTRGRPQCDGEPDVLEAGAETSRAAPSPAAILDIARVAHRLVCEIGLRPHLTWRPPFAMWSIQRAAGKGASMAVATGSAAPTESEPGRIAALAAAAESLLWAEGRQSTSCTGGYRATAAGVSRADLHVTMITPSPRLWGGRPPRTTPSPEPTSIRVDVRLGGEGKVFSYDRLSDGAVVVIQFTSGDWEGMLLRLGNEGSPQRAGPVPSVVFQRH